jgi:hypothetical protein
MALHHVFAHGILVFPGGLGRVRTYHVTKATNTICSASVVTIIVTTTHTVTSCTIITATTATITVTANPTTTASC